MKKYLYGNGSVIKAIIITIVIACSSFVYFFSTHKSKDAKIYFISGYFHNLFGNDKNGFFNLANIIKKKGYEAIDTNNSYRHLKDAKYIVVFDIHKKKLRKLKRLPQKKLILFTFEPPCIISENHEKKYHHLFKKIYTFNDDLIDNKKIFKFYFPDAKPMLENIKSFEKKKLCCLISSNKLSNHKTELYSERKKAIKYFETYAIDEFDLYGHQWEKSEFPSYKGLVIDKIDILKNYKFAICFENSKNINGYITEKIFNCFQAGCVPIYLGADNITKYIPQNCFIDKRNFKSYNELFIYLKTMTKKDYDAYLQNINNFLNSDKAKLFTGETLVKTFLKALDLEEGP